MKAKILLILIYSLNIYALNIQGRIDSAKCNSKDDGQLFISHESKLIYQIEIPRNGTFSVNLPKNDYQVSYITKDGCEALTNVKLEKDILDLVIEVKRD